MSSVVAETALLIAAVGIAVGYFLDRERFRSERAPYRPDSNSIPSTITSVDSIPSNLKPYYLANIPIGFGVETTKHYSAGLLDRARNVNGSQVARGETKHRTHDQLLKFRAAHRYNMIPEGNPAKQYWLVVGSHA